MGEDAAGVTMTTNPTARSVLASLAIACLPLIALAQTYPRTLVASAEVTGSGGASTATVTIHIERLMHDIDFKSVSDALKYGGYPNFVPALRKLPSIGYVEVGGRRTELKYARERSDGKPRLVLGTDRPIYFVGGGAPDAKPKAGYEVAVIDLEFDAQGNGQGTMAAAARVKPAPDGGVTVDDYAVAPIRLTTKPAK
jgi:hypothetical protein